MSKYLVKTTEVWRADTKAEADTLIRLAQEDSIYELSKYNCEQKVKMSKGEVDDEWYKVTLVKNFTNEKEPGNIQVEVSYA